MARSPELFLTVLIATRNGGSALGEVLSAYAREAVLSSGWNLLVVDNGSTDATADLLASRAGELPLDVIKVPEPGKNRALNSAIAQVDGDFVVLTDDDAVPHEGFVEAWRRVAADRPDHALFGGVVQPRFEKPPPEWLARHAYGSAMLFAERSLTAGPIGWDGIYGGNMAVRRAIFDAGFRFDERLGPNAADPLYPMGSESEFCRRVAHAGHRCWFAPEPKVSHIVEAGQLEWSAWATRAYRSGRGRAFMIATDPTQAARHPDFARSKFALLKMTIRDTLKLISPSPARRFEALCAIRFRQGYAAERARW